MSDNFGFLSPAGQGADNHEPLDLDDVDPTDPADLVSDVGDVESKDTGAGERQPARGITRAQIRRIAVKAQDVAEAEPRVCQVAAHLVGASSQIAELTTAIMSADRAVTQPLNDLSAIAEADPMEAGILAGGLERPRLRGVWSLLAALDAGPKGNIPPSETKAALALAKAVFALDDIAKAEITAVTALLKKS